MRFDPVTQEYYVSLEFPDGSNYPPGTSDMDFDDDPDGTEEDREPRGIVLLPDPKTQMVYCSLCMRHWKAPFNGDSSHARIELCPEHNEKGETKC